MNSIMVFQSGLIGAAQSNTARNKATAQLAAGKVPTAIAVSNSNEFAFITVWDTVNLRGEIAVVALAGLCDSCTHQQPGRLLRLLGRVERGLPGAAQPGQHRRHEGAGLRAAAGRHEGAHRDLGDHRRRPQRLPGSGHARLRLALGPVAAERCEQAQPLQGRRQSLRHLRQDRRGGGGVQVRAEGGLRRPEAPVPVLPEHVLRQRRGLQRHHQPGRGRQPVAAHVRRRAPSKRPR